MIIDDVIHIIKPIIEGVAATFGPNCEIVLHDLRNLENSVVLIKNGHLTGRKIGSPITDLALYLLKSNIFKEADYIANYRTKTRDGREMKSTTMFIRDKNGKAIGMLCINYVIDQFIKMRKELEDICGPKNEINGKVINKVGEENFIETVDELFEKILNKAIKITGKQLDKMKREDKIELVRYLNKQGVFLLKQNILKVAKKLNVSVNTIYNYLSQIKNDSSSITII